MEADHRKAKRRAGLPWLCSLAALLAIAATGAVAEPAHPGGSGETAACLDCHEDQSANLARGPHAVVVDEGGALSKLVSCTSCHAGSSAHWEDDPESNPMTDPTALDAMAAGRLCAGCHAGAHQTDQHTLGAHADAEVTCFACHQVHGAPVAFGQLTREQPGLCTECHGAVAGQFAQPSHHPVAEGMVSCTDCHLQGDDAATERAFGGNNASCYACHPQFRGPFPYEHQATVDYSTEGGGCATCHDPHGSALPRLLTQPYEAPHFQLCTQCHSVPRHAFNTQHGTEFAGDACADCHTDIHGSYTNRLFLTPALAAQGCLAIGCHGGQ